MVVRLLATGADVDAAQASGLTALMIAARTGDARVLRLLLTQGANVDAATRQTRSTALMWAVAESHPDSVRALLAAGADPRASTAAGFTPLLFAARNGDVEMGPSPARSRRRRRPHRNRRHARAPLRDRQGTRRVRAVPARSGRRPERRDGRGDRPACRRGPRRHLARRVESAARRRRTVQHEGQLRFRSDPRAAAGEGAAGARGEPERPHRRFRHVHELHRLSQEGRVRTLRRRHRRPARRHAAVGGRLQRERAGSRTFAPGAREGPARWKEPQAAPAPRCSACSWPRGPSRI